MECNWEKTKRIYLGDTENRPPDMVASHTRLYGREHWENYLETNTLDLLRIKPEGKQYIRPFDVGNVNFYKFLTDNGWFNGTEDHFMELAAESNDVFHRYDTSIITLLRSELYRNRPKNNLVAEVLVLLKDIYRYGTFNFPCAKVIGPNRSPFIAAHPGQHLIWAMLTLNADPRMLLSVCDSSQEKFKKIEHGFELIQHVKSDADLQEALGLSEYRCWIQNGKQLVPSIFPLIPRLEWKNFTKAGVTRWPEAKTTIIPWVKRQEWLEAFDTTNPTGLDQFVEAKTDEMDPAKILGFLLNDIGEDDLFIKKWNRKCPFTTTKEKYLLHTPDSRLKVVESARQDVYGREHWDEFIATHQMVLVNMESSGLEYLAPHTSFRDPTVGWYDVYVKEYNYNKSYSEYEKECQEVNQVICQYDSTIMSLLHNQLFQFKELPGTLLLIREIYKNGTVNYPCAKFGKYKGRMTVMTHPGTHLMWINIFLGNDIEFFLSFNDNSAEAYSELEAHLLTARPILYVQDIIDIIGTDDMWIMIQKYHNGSVPSIFPHIPHTGWDVCDEHKYRNIGDWSQMNAWVKEQEWLDMFLNETVAEDYGKFVHVKNHFDKGKILYNNILAFLLGDVKEDANFKRH